MKVKSRPGTEERALVNEVQIALSDQDADEKSSEAEAKRAVDHDEAALIGAARSDPGSFGVLYERYVDRIYAYIYHRVGNAQDAEDLTARTFYRALGKLDTYEDRGLPFSAWLFRIAHNLVANWHRDRSKRRFLSLDRLWSHSNDSSLPEYVVEAEEKHDALWAAINRLPADRRDLLIHKFSGRLSNVEIGELMDKSESAVKSLYFRTLSSLRQDLEARGWGASSHDMAELTTELAQDSEAEAQDQSHWSSRSEKR